MKKITILISFFLFFILISVISFSNIVKGTTVGVTLSNWDDVASGLDSGTSGYFDFKSMGFANYFETSTDADLSAPNSFKVSGIGTDKGTGYWNLTSDFSYIGSINFSFYLSTLGVGRRIDMMFNDSSGNRLLYMYWSQIGNAFAWYDISSGWHNIYTLSLSTRYYCVITHNGTNQFNIKVLSSAFAVLANADYAGSYASDWSNFSYVYLYGYSTAAGNVAGYFDNIKIDTAPHSGSTKRTIGIKFIDAVTGASLGLLPDAIDYLNLNGYIDSDLLDSPIDINSSGNAHVGLLSCFNFDNWIDGTSHTLTVTDAYCKRLIGGNLDIVYYDDYSVTKPFVGSIFVIPLQRQGTYATGNETIVGDENGNKSVRFRFRDTLGQFSFFHHYGDYGALYDDYPYVSTLYGKCAWWSDYVGASPSYNLSSSHDSIVFTYNFTDGDTYNFQFYDLWSYTPYGDYVHFESIWTHPVMYNNSVFNIQLTIAYYENKTTGEITDTMPVPIKPSIIPKDITDFIEPYKLYIGIGLVVVMTLIPLIAGMLLASKTQINVMNIPPLVYVSFFLIGVVLSTVLGFFDLWVIFFVVFALILVFAITWINGRPQGS